MLQRRVQAASTQGAGRSKEPRVAHMGESEDGTHGPEQLSTQVLSGLLNIMGPSWHYSYYPYSE